MPPYILADRWWHFRCRFFLCIIKLIKF